MLEIAIISLISFIIFLSLSIFWIIKYKNFENQKYVDEGNIDEKKTLKKEICISITFMLLSLIICIPAHISKTSTYHYIEDSECSKYYIGNSIDSTNIIVSYNDTLKMYVLDNDKTISPYEVYETLGYDYKIIIKKSNFDWIWNLKTVGEWSINNLY